MPRIAPAWIGWAIALLPGFLPAQVRISESRDGATVTLPTDEADLAKSFLNIATVWKEAFGGGKFTLSLREYLENPKAAENSQRHIAGFAKRFLDEIRKTPRKRTNIGTVYHAYKTIGGGNLKAHAQRAPRPE